MSIVDQPATTYEFLRLSKSSITSDYGLTFYYYIFAFKTSLGEIIAFSILSEKSILDADLPLHSNVNYFDLAFDCQQRKNVFIIVYLPSPSITVSQLQQNMIDFVNNVLPESLYHHNIRCADEDVTGTCTRCEATRNVPICAGMQIQGHVEDGFSLSPLSLINRFNLDGTKETLNQLLQQFYVPSHFINVFSLEPISKFLISQQCIKCMLISTNLNQFLYLTHSITPSINYQLLGVFATYQMFSFVGMYASYIQLNGVSQLNFYNALQSFPITSSIYSSNNLVSVAQFSLLVATYRISTAGQDISFIILVPNPSNKYSQTFSAITSNTYFNISINTAGLSEVILIVTSQNYSDAYVPTNQDYLDLATNFSLFLINNLSISHTKDNYCFNSYGLQDRACIKSKGTPYDCEYQCSECDARFNSTCSSCPQTRLLTSDFQCICKDGYYNQQGVKECQSCHPSCITCTDYKRCITCNSTGLFVPAPNNFCLCQSGYYGDKFCSACLLPCKECDASPIQCTSCVGNLTLNTYNCGCLRGTYFINASYCGYCNYPCFSCGDGSTCWSCSAHSFRVYDSIARQCNCPAGYLDLKTHICGKCVKSCATCIGTTTNCTSCDSNLKRVFNNTNFKCFCADGYYENTNLDCITCDSNCKTCVTTSTTCLSCNTNGILLTNKSCSCPPIFIMINGICTCPSDRQLNISTNMCDCLNNFVDNNGVCTQPQIPTQNTSLNSTEQNQTQNANVTNQTNTTNQDTGNTTNQTALNDSTNQTNQQNQTNQSNQTNETNQTNITDLTNQTNQINQTDLTNQTDQINQTNSTNQTDQTNQTNQTNQTDQTNHANQPNQTNQPNQINQTNQTDQTNQTNQTDQINQTDQTILTNQTNQTDQINQTDLTNQTDQINQTDQTNVDNQQNQTNEITQTSNTDLSNQSSANQSQTSEIVSNQINSTTPENNHSNSTIQVNNTTKINSSNSTPNNSNQEQVVQLSLCGNGIINSHENCDDGNVLDRDGCSQCQIDIGYVCNIKQAPSICSQCKMPYCLSCTWIQDVQVCVVCQQGYYNQNNTCFKCLDVCAECIGPSSSDCLQCSDHSLSAKQNSTNTTKVCEVCSSTLGLYSSAEGCKAICGDGILMKDYAEQCDDGNIQDGDGCSYDCQIEKDTVCKDGRCEKFYPPQAMIEYADQITREVLILKFDQSLKQQEYCNSFSLSIYDQKLNTDEYTVQQSKAQGNGCKIVLKPKNTIKSGSQITLTFVKQLSNDKNQILQQNTLQIGARRLYVYSKAQIVQAQKIKDSVSALPYIIIFTAIVMIFLGGVDVYWTILDVIGWINTVNYFNVDFPLNVQVLFSSISIAQVLSVPQGFQMSTPDDSYYQEAKPKYEEQGMTACFLGNVQSDLYIILAFNLFQGSVRYLLGVLRQNPSTEKSILFLRKIDSNYFSNQIKLFNLLYLDFLTASLIQIQAGQPFRHIFITFNLFLSLISLSISQMLPILFSKFALKSPVLLNHRVWRGYQPLYSDFNLFIGMAKKQFPFTSLKKNLFVLAQIQIYDYPLLQVAVSSMICASGILAMLYQNPFTSKELYIRTLITDISFILCGIVTSVISIDQKAPKEQLNEYNLGWIIVTAATIAITIQISQIFSVVASELRRLVTPKETTGKK